MSSLFYTGPGRLEWREQEEVVLGGPKEAIVRPFIAARCDGDVLPLLHRARGAINLAVALHHFDPVVHDVLGRPPFQPPYAFGHECVAEVLTCGAEVRQFVPGDQVVVPWSVSCGGCSNCHRGLSSRCQTADSGQGVLAGYGFGPAMGPWGGAVSDAVRVPYADAMLLKVPQGVDPLALASASDNLPDGWRTVAPTLRHWPGAPVLIVGGGAKSIGLYAAACAVALGSEQVDYLDSHDGRLQIAEAVGANPIAIERGSRWLKCHAPRVHGKYPITVDCSASLAGLRFALRSLTAGGVCTGVGYYFHRQGGLPLMQMYANDSTLRIGISHPRADLPEVLALVASGRLKPQAITSLVADWQDAPEAFLERTTKVVVQRPVLGVG